MLKIAIMGPLYGVVGKTRPGSMIEELMGDQELQNL